MKELSLVDDSALAMVGLAEELGYSVEHDSLWGDCSLYSAGVLTVSLNFDVGEMAFAVRVYNGAGSGEQPVFVGYRVHLAAAFVRGLEAAERKSFRKLLEVVRA